MKIIKHTRRAAQSGQALLEMSLCLLFVFLMMFGIVEYSRLMYAFNFVSYAAQAGARYACVHGSSSASPLSITSPNSATNNAVTTLVQSMAVGLSTSNMTVTTSYLNGSNAPDSSVTVQVSYVENPLLTVVLPNATTVTSSSTMVILQ